MDGDKTVKLAYIKVKIVRDAPVMQNFARIFKGTEFAFKCNQTAGQMVYDYKEFSIQILKEYNLTWHDFLDRYPLENGKWDDLCDVKYLGSYTDTKRGETITINGLSDRNGNVLREGTANHWELGWVEFLNDEIEDPSEEGTIVVRWYICNKDLWKHAGETVYNIFRCWTPDHSNYFDIILEAQIPQIDKIYHINKENHPNGGEYADNYWYPDVKTGDKYGFTRFNVNVPSPEGNSNPLDCDFVNNLNAAFKNHNGEIVLTSDNNDFVASDIKYYFHNKNNRTVRVLHPGRDGETPRTITIEKNGDYELVASGLDMFGGRHTREWIARIDNNGVNVKNTLIYNKNSVLAKELMNYIVTEAEAHEGQEVSDPKSPEYLEKVNVMEVYIGAHAYVCGNEDYRVEVVFHRKNGDAGKDYYVGHILKPVYLYHQYVDNFFIDGVDVGEAHSYIDLADYLDIPRFHDWRKRLFGDYQNFWQYYGIEQQPMGFVGDLSKMLPTAKCNLKINGDDSWKPIPSTIEIGYQQNPNSIIGYLTYKNNGINVEDNFKIRTDIVINYGWGTYIIPDVEIEVKKTKDTPF